jgi:hypothetical protein
MLAAKPRRLAGAKPVLQQEGASAIDCTRAVQPASVRRWRGLLLSGTALSLGAAFSLAVSPAALAACTTAGANPVEITCDDTTTLNTDNNTDSRNHIHNDNIEAEVEADATIDGYGLRIETTAANGSIEMEHNGDEVILTEAGANTGSALLGPGALELNGNGGLVTYSGSGDVSNLTATGAGLLITNTGDGSVVADVSGTITGPAGIVVSVEGNGTIDLTTNGPVVGTAGHGIHTLAEDGDTSITANADVTATEDGIHARSTTGNITITGGGNIRGDSDDDGTGDGINAESTGGGNVVVDVTGDITGASGIVLTANLAGAIDVTTGGAVEGTDGDGINTFAVDGDTTIITNGTVTGSEDGIDATAFGDGSITITATDSVVGTAGDGIVTSTFNGDTTITTNAVTGGDDGIDASTVNVGNITITTNGPVVGTIGDGIVASTLFGDIEINANADVTGGVNGIVTSANDGDTTITTNGVVTGGAVGISATAAGGNIDIAATEDVTGGSEGIVADASGAGTVTVTTTGDVTGTSGVGIQTFAGTGATVIDTSGEVTGGFDGIAAISGFGDVTIMTSGAVEGEIGTGILASVTSGDIAITADGDVTGGEDGILAQSTTGNIAIAGSGNITGDSNIDGTGDGINAASSSGGNIEVNVSGDVTGVSGIVLSTNLAGTIDLTTGGAVEGTAGDGIDASASGLGDINVTTNAAVTGGVDGIVTSANDGDTAITTNGIVTGGAVGISATAAGGNIDIAATEDVTGGSEGIVADASGAGTVTVTTTGDVTGTSGVGIMTFADTGATMIDTSGEVTGGLDGIAAISGAGDVTIMTSGAVEGEIGIGILTSVTSGNTVITANADVTGGEDGIFAQSTTGNIEVGVAGDATVTGLTGAGVSTDTAAGTASIENAGLIQGAFAAISGATSTVLDVVNQAGGLIQNLSGELADLAISVTGTGATDIENDGTIRGRISLDAGDDTFINSGVWATTGLSDFGAGNDSVTNTGRLVVAEQAAVAEITHLANLESFTNASTGVIDMVDDNAPNVRDELTIDGLYTGVPGSIIAMDLALVSGDPQAGSDLLILDGAIAAQGTSDFLFNIVSTGVTATTTDANRVAFAGGQLVAPVTVVENRGDLTTSSGDDTIPLARSGLITYDLVSTAAAGGDFQVVSQLDAGLAGGLLLPIPATLATVAFTTQRTPNPITATCIDPDNKPNAQGGWVRGLAGEFNTESAGKASTGGVSTELESENRTRFKTLQGGFDHVLCNIDSFGSTLHFGVTVGQTWGDSQQKDPDPAAGIFGTDVKFDTFFVGPYAAFTRGNFAAQASLRFDYHSLELTNPTVGVDADGLGVDAQGISGSASMSYDFALANLTLTPDAGVNVSNTDIDKFDIAGGTVVLDDLWSVMGHVGVTARTEPLGLADNLFVVPFASATLYHEFIEHADGQIDIGGTVIEAKSNRVGTFGQLGIGANAVRLGDVVAGRPTLFGGARFDLQVGERIEGATATVFGRVQF